MFATTLQGFTLGLAMIIPIGAQNAFVLRQGLQGRHVLAVCLTCAGSDALLIGEVVAPDGKRFDLQLKGSGPTPFSR